MSDATDMQSDPGILHGDLHLVTLGLEWAAAIVDVLAILVMLIGAVRFVTGYVRAELSHDGLRRVKGIDYERVELGRYILAGLELLIVSDIIHTALSLAIEDLLFLGLLVVIRSLISFFLGRELAEVKHEMAERDRAEGNDA
ncbi:MAG: DUF1622 domain-containing protein [Paracoccaceae bacterium]